MNNILLFLTFYNIGTRTASRTINDYFIFIIINIILIEVDFFRLGEKALCTMQENEGSTEVEEQEMPKLWWQLYIWKLFEYPDSSLGKRTRSEL